MLKAISWNIAHRPALWRVLVESDVDVALLQEACAPPADLSTQVVTDSEPWRVEGAGLVREWRAAVARVGARVEVQWHVTRSICEAKLGELAVSRLGTLAAADVRDPDTDEVFTFVSMYSPWESPLTSTGSKWIYADASAHRLISDLSVFIGQERRHRVIAAGDLNILFGYGENSSPYWAARYQTVFDRFAAIGLQFVGPQSPAGRQAEPWPSELPRHSLNVPTFRSAQQTLENAARQLDFVFASADIADRVKVEALNRPNEWGQSDHCRVRIEIASAPHLAASHD